MVDDVPWLVADPGSTRFEWRNRWQMALQDLELKQRNAREAIAAGPGPASLARLTNLADGYAAQHSSLKKLLQSLGLARPADLTTYLALKTRLPSQLGLTSYEANIFRDWCWGKVENDAAKEAVAACLTDHSVQNILILGAGAGRLAYDLHQTLAPSLTVALELNPYLTGILKRLSAGESIEQTEFPLAPKEGGRSAVSHLLEAPAPVEEGFEVILADAMRPPFQTGSFDVVVTPWLLDVIDAPPSSVLDEINRLLRPGGIWIYHGSLAFNRADVLENINLEELVEVAAASGFETISTSERVGPYLNCPDSRHGREEQVLTLSHRKNADRPPLPRHQNLPDWIAKGRDPVPALPGFQNQAAVTRIHAFIMSLIDGRRSLKDMAEVMEAQKLMPKEDAETAIRGFLIKMFDEASSGRRF